MSAGRLAGAPWDDADAQHVRRAIFAAPLRTEPSPYLFVEGLFPDALYRAMLQNFPSGDVLRRWNNPGEPGMRFGNYDRRREIHIPAEAARLPDAQRAFWLSAAAFLHGEAFAHMLLERFAPYARERFGSELDDPSFARERLRGTMILNAHDAEYYLGPHTDRGEKVFTCLFYFPEHAGLDHLGTTLYRPLQAGFTSDGLAHHDPAEFEPTETAPYRENAALIFARTDVMFHGVHALTDDALGGSLRRSIQMQFWVHNERPRAECRTQLDAILPASLAPGQHHAVNYRLTNRSRAVLESGFPYPTTVGGRWFSRDGREVAGECAVRSPLPQPLERDASCAGTVAVTAPTDPGTYELRLSVLQEGVAWFDDIDPDNGVAATVVVAGDDVAAASASTPLHHARRDDIVAERDDIALGAGWGALERSAGVPFRWVEDDAAIDIAMLRPVRTLLQLSVEAGPGLGDRPLTLRAYLADGAVLGPAVVTGRGNVSFALPAEAPRIVSVRLRADERGACTPDDPRVLTFRVFSVTVARERDVFPAWAQVCGGAYPLERSEGELFRWFGAEARLEVRADTARVLTFTAEAGPGMGSRPFELTVFDGAGAALHAATIGSRTVVQVPVAAGTSALILRAPDGGVPLPGESRTLNYRVFADS